MPLPWSDEQRAVQETFRAFAERELIPGAARRDASAEYPAHLIARLGELSAMGIALPEEHGGLGLSTATQLIAIEEVAYGDAALASIFTAHYLGAEALLLGGSEQQQKEYLPPLATGRMIAGFALTEPGAGSDIGSITARARAGGEDWLLTGSKTFISNAREAGLLVVFARTDDGAGLDGISAFLFPAGTPGVSFSPPQDKSGIRSAPTYTVFLDDARLPGSALLGERGRGGRLALRTLNHARIDIAAMANGIAMRALQLAAGFSAGRVQFGHPIREFQAIQLLLGEMDASLEASRLTAFWAAEAKDAGQDVRREAAIAKYLATETCSRVVDAALQVHGGAGYLRESEVERLYRDCRVLRLYEGTSQIQLLTIARTLADRLDRQGRVV
jgi:alkylation response protein AidB-like acyl-CoA dehydrogenase